MAANTGYTDEQVIPVDNQCSVPPGPFRGLCKICLMVATQGRGSVFRQTAVGALIKKRQLHGALRHCKWDTNRTWFYVFHYFLGGSGALFKWSMRRWIHHCESCCYPTHPI